MRYDSDSTSPSEKRAPITTIGSQRDDAVRRPCRLIAGNGNGCPQLGVSGPSAFGRPRSRVDVRFWWKADIAVNAASMVAGAMSIALLIIGAAFMLYAIWRFIAGLGTIKPTGSDTETRSRSDGTWWG